MTSLAAIAAEQGGVFLTRQALAAGYSPQEIRALRRRGEWVHLRRGAYCTRAVRETLPGDVGLHQLVVRSVALVLAEPAVISHVSAAAMLGLPLHRAALGDVHVTRADLHSGRREAGVHHHEGRLDAMDLHRLDDGLLVTSSARTVVDVARWCDVPTALVLADAALRSGLARADLDAMFDSMRDWQWAREAGRVIVLADGRWETVGESLMRLTLVEGGLPAPEPQVEFREPWGEVWARVDGYYAEERTIVEFDGRVKYGTDPEVLWREKRREDRLRELAHEVVRVTWDDLPHPPRLVARVRAAFARARARRPAA